MIPEADARRAIAMAGHGANVSQIARQLACSARSLIGSPPWLIRDAAGQAILDGPARRSSACSL